MNHPLWQPFTEYAEVNGIDIGEDGWETWWACFLSGSIAGCKAMLDSQLGPIRHELEHAQQTISEAMARHEPQDKGRTTQGRREGSG